MGLTMVRLGWLVGAAAGCLERRLRNGYSAAPPQDRSVRVGGQASDSADLIKLSPGGAVHPGPIHATGSGSPGAAGRYVRPRSRYARLPR